VYKIHQQQGTLATNADVARINNSRTNGATGYVNVRAKDAYACYTCQPMVFYRQAATGGAVVAWDGAPSYTGFMQQQRLV
jgi:hypothetical protein